MAVTASVFSSLWYRVSALRPAIADRVRIERQSCRGEVWHLLIDPRSGRSLRLNRSAYAIAGRLTATHSVQQVWDAACAELGDDAPTQDECIGILAQLHERGCTFALDDFGTGMSSFVYLKELDVQYLKIAGPFVKNMSNSSLDEAIVRNFANFARQMGLVTIAEWVEDQKTEDLLRDMQVDYAQGYLHGRARPLGVTAAAAARSAGGQAA